MKNFIKFIEKGIRVYHKIRKKCKKFDNFIATNHE